VQCIVDGAQSGTFSAEPPDASAHSHDHLVSRMVAAMELAAARPVTIRRPQSSSPAAAD
jgi:hypothetical protein